MNRSELASSIVGEYQENFFKHKLSTSSEKVELYFQNVQIIGKSENENEYLSKIDTALTLLSLHALQCYDQSHPESKAIEGKERNISECNINSGKKCSLICTNPECTYKLFGRNAAKDHYDNCSRSGIELNPEYIKEKGFYKEYCQSQSHKIDTYLEKIDDYSTDLKSKFGNLVDKMAKHWKNEILTMTKENLLEFAINQIETRYNEYEQNSNFLM